MSITTATDEQRFLLHAVPWETYEALLEHFGDRPIRITYDDGDLELMSPSQEHERFKKFFARFIEALTEELNIPIFSVGSRTFRKRPWKRGLEPDECYYIQHELLARAKAEIDLSVDPPPDLVVEIDISRSSIDRMAIYATLGVPEVWRYDATALQVYHLQPSGDYLLADVSLSFPFLSLTEFAGFLSVHPPLGETGCIRSFREWVRTSYAKEQRKP